MDRSRLAINQITTPRWSLSQAIDGYARAGATGIGIWRDKLAEAGLASARAMIRDAGLWVPSLCKTGDVGRLDTEGATAAVDDCRRAIDEASEIGAACVVFVSGGSAPSRAGVDEARKRVADVLRAAADYARSTNVRIGLEPFHPMHTAERGCINTLSQAFRLRDSIGDGVSVVFDIFHCWWDPGLLSHIRGRDLSAIATVHLCDWRVPTRHPVQDRAMPGDGAADVANVVREFERSGYRGPYEIEVFSDDWAERDPSEVADICVKRYDSLA